MGLQLYFPVGHDSRAASFSYTKSINPPVKLCQSCWKFGHGVPSARRGIRGLGVPSLEGLERKGSPAAKWKKQCICRRMSWKSFTQRSRGFRQDGGPLYIKGKRKMENIRRCPWTQPAPLRAVSNGHALMLWPFCSNFHAADAVSGSSIHTQPQPGAAQSTHPPLRVDFKPAVLNLRFPPRGEPGWP